jgi:hypothetical protein
MVVGVLLDGGIRATMVVGVLLDGGGIRATTMVVVGALLVAAGRVGAGLAAVRSGADAVGGGSLGKELVVVVAVLPPLAVGGSGRREAARLIPKNMMDK